MRLCLAAMCDVILDLERSVKSKGSYAILLVMRELFMKICCLLAADEISVLFSICSVVCI